MKLNKSLLVLTLVAVLALSLAAFGPITVQAKDRTRQKTCDNSIVDIALAVNAETGEFSTLVAAVKAANLVKPLDNCKKIMTVFAPTDAAFEKLGLNAENIGTAFSKKALTNILLYHLTRGSYFAADVVTMDKIYMANRGYVGVDVTENGVFLTSNNDPAQIIQTDIAASNGVIHVIDNVLLP